MALEELIIAWTQDRPAWQREIMRRVATGEALADDDYDRLVEDIVAGKSPSAGPFGLEQLPQAAAEDPPVRLVSIEQPEHVNALESKDPLTFEPNGLIIIYGDNGSGKSGYARLLKRIARARHQEDVLTDVFRDTAIEKPKALLSLRVGDVEETIEWPEAARPELQRMRFYDGACGSAYIATESDFPYRPSALFVMDGLIEACVAVRTRLDAKLTENGSAANELPGVSEEIQDTDTARFLKTLSGGTSVERLDLLIKRFDESPEPIEALKDQEARLRSADTSRERQNLTRQSQKLDALAKHLEAVHAILGADALSALRGHRETVKTLEAAGAVLAQTFESEPLQGVGSSPWKALWEAARRFSEEHAYPGQAFPVVDPDCRCVLCQQKLIDDAHDRNEHVRERLSRFENFVKDDTQVRLQEARRIYDAQVERHSSFAVVSEAVATNLGDLKATHADLVSATRELLGQYEAIQCSAREALRSSGEIPGTELDPAPMVARLGEASRAAKAVAEDLSNPEVVQRQLAEVTRRRMELELLKLIKLSRVAILREIARLKEREALEAAKTAAATGPITKKINELSEESITEVVRDAFTRETERLGLERVTIARTRADKGVLFHQPKLVGARQRVTLPRVFSEGERNALGLAAFFTEAHLDASNSAIILDDPVTSLDHIRRGLVAARLAALAEARQVVVFTHDASFVLDLKKAAKTGSVLVTERSVTRSRADEQKPGACGTAHPWKAKDVPARLDELRSELARIKREQGTWDQDSYEKEVGSWAGGLSQTWERIFSQEIVGQVLAEGGLEVRPMMVKVLARFSSDDHSEFEASYSRVSQWARRHDPSALVNYVAPEVDRLQAELDLVDAWFKRVKGYKNG
ncbi:MAG: hypothetical protein WD766_04260 [Gemmatimonadota bacterium]